MLFEILGQGLSLAGAGVGAKAEDLPVANADRAAISAAEFDCRRNECAEHRLQIEGRAADDLQHLGGRGLKLQRLRQIARARLHLVEQPHVLDRDDGLVGKGLHEFDLALGEGPRLRAHQREDAFEFAVAQQRHAHAGAIVPDDLATVIVVFLVLRNVGYQHDSAQQARPSGHRLAVQLGRIAPQQFRELRRAPGLRHELEDAVPIEGNHAVGRVAKFDRGPGQAVEHRVEIERRAADDLQHVGGRGLLLQRLLEVASLCLHLVEHARVLDRDHRLIGEAAQQLQFPLAERARRAAQDRDGAQAAILPKHGCESDRYIAGSAHTFKERRRSAGFREPIGNMVNAAFTDDATCATPLERHDVVSSR